MEQALLEMSLHVSYLIPAWHLRAVAIMARLWVVWPLPMWSMDISMCCRYPGTTQSHGVTVANSNSWQTSPSCGRWSLSIHS